MLVLSREEGESITIGGCIEIKILRTGRRIHIGISAPQEINIVRTELPTRDKIHHSSR